MKERHIRIADGKGWYTDELPEAEAIAQFAGRISRIGPAFVPTVKVYYLHPREDVPSEIRDRVIAAALRLAKAK